MREYKIINGNLLNATEDFICHQVNCQGKMNSGVAKAIRQTFPSVYTEYYNMYLNHTSNLLGEIQIVQIQTEQYPHYCINMFAQDNYGYDGKQYTSLDGFKKCLEKINHNCSGFTVAFPWKIACVRGGADWNQVLPLILETLTDVKEIVFYKLDLG